MTEPETTAPTSMDEQAKRVLVNYVRDIADRMGLKDWQFDISARDPEPGAICSTDTWGDSQTATLRIGNSFWKYGPRMQREVIVHELTHWHTDIFFTNAREVMRRTLGREAFELSLASLKQARELAVDSIASAWAREFPVIDWNDGRPLYHGYEDQPSEDDDMPAKGAVEDD